MKNLSDSVIAKAKRIKLLLTDCDGVLTDGCVYYSAAGEEMKKFSFRDGMGVERLRTLANIETGIITGEKSAIVLRRAIKLGINEYHPEAKNKYLKLQEILQRRNLDPAEVAYMGDDTNDMDIMKSVGLSCCPANAFSQVNEIADIVVSNKGGDGAFREFAEIIINAQLKQ